MSPRIASFALFSTCCALVIGLLAPAVKGETASKELPPPETAEALRLMKSRCFGCHNEQKHKGGLVMTSREGLLKGGEEGPALVAGAPEESSMIAALAADADPHMPPKKQLSPKQIELLTTWVKDGARWDPAALRDEARPVTLAALPSAYQPVLALSLSPDGRQLAVGCGNELVLYDVAEKSLSVARRASAHPDPVQSIAWSPDGKRIATGAFRRAVLWDVADLTPGMIMTAGLSDRITALRFAPDGHTLFLADGRIAESGIIRIADATTGGVIASWPAHDDSIFDLAVSGTGEFLATVGGDRMVKIWDLSTQREKARMEGHTAQVLTVAFNTDGSQLITGGADQQLKVWDVKTKDQLIALGKHSAGISAVAWAPGGSALFAVTDAGGLLRYTDFKSHTGAQSSESATERKMDAAETALYCVSATAAADRIFAGSHDGRIFGWNKDGKLLSKTTVNEPVTTATAAR